MTIREALREGTALLQKAGVPDADVDACLLLANLLKEDTLVLRIEGQRELSEEKPQGKARTASIYSGRNGVHGADLPR